MRPFKLFILHRELLAIAVVRNSAVVLFTLLIISRNGLLFAADTDNQPQNTGTHTAASASEHRQMSSDDDGDWQSVANLYTRKGADTCLKCHDQDYSYPVLDIFYSKHGNRRDPRSPMAQLQCETCHGPGRAHATEPMVGKPRAHILDFSAKSSDDVDQQNVPCLRCHQNVVTHWQESVHQKQNLRCAACHQIHARRDPILNSKTQASVCYRCHLQQQSEFHRYSAHPLGVGDMSCSRCHDPHGSLNPRLLRAATTNDLCYSCHAEKRGPFLWVHAPVQEDCTICHEQHGSAQANLLKQRPPFLCQSCHSVVGHSSFALSASDQTGTDNSNYLMSKSCLNCHFQIHGSNHPSGVRFMR